MRKRIPLPVSAPSLLALATAVVLFAYGGIAAAQTPFVPYFGKNRIHYDNFEWYIYTTDHFESSNSIWREWRRTPRAPTSRSARI